jgi:hypothetical protein
MGFVCVLSAFAAGVVGCLGGDDSAPPSTAPADAGNNHPSGLDASGDANGQVNPDGGDAGEAAADAPVDSPIDVPVIDSPVDSPVDAPIDTGAALRSAVGLSSGGTVSKSPNYILIGNVGESPGTHSALHSPSYTFHGGFAGASQK